MPHRLLHACESMHSSDMAHCQGSLRSVKQPEKRLGMHGDAFAVTSRPTRQPTLHPQDLIRLQATSGPA